MRLVILQKYKKKERLNMCFKLTFSAGCGLLTVSGFIKCKPHRSTHTPIKNVNQLQQVPKNLTCN